MTASATVPIERIAVAAYTIPTEAPESDATFEWDSTTIVVVHAHAAGQAGLGYTYADSSTACLVRDRLGELVRGKDAMEPEDTWQRMIRSVRNLGRPGIASMAIAAVDTALWDLKARLLQQPLVSLLGRAREDVPVYGSGGFTSYTIAQLREQLAGWVEQGIPRVKMKVGREPASDVDRVRAARQAIGPSAELFVDANGAYSREQAMELARTFAEERVTWFEEPVVSDDVDGLRLVRADAPAGMDVTAGEYGYDLMYFQRLLRAGAVDVIQPDVTRCAGITELLRIARMADGLGFEISLHTAPALHLHPACAVSNLRHTEYFHDHVRIEHMLFDGIIQPRDALLRPDATRPGNGLEFRTSDAEPFAI
ncbi:MAG TPA: enolase C-terminal domain-like protein [Gemmatimonadaceae bacterium]|nr:enolase C-terminal domain-like protein [Gemmatimonadaceae bacterium]